MNDPVEPKEFLLGARENHREAFVYKLADVVSVPTYKTRYVEVTYFDTKNPESVFHAITYKAFFAEDMDAFRKRNKALEVKAIDDPFRMPNDPNKDGDLYEFEHVSSSKISDQKEIAKMIFFQMYIGNMDWFLKMNQDHFRDGPESRERLWNIKLYQDVNLEWHVLPHDFNFSALGLGRVGYPMQPKELSYIDGSVIKAAAQEFRQQESAFAALIEKAPDVKDFKEVLKYNHKSFFENLKKYEQP